MYFEPSIEYRYHIIEMLTIVLVDTEEAAARLLWRVLGVVAPDHFLLHAHAFVSAKQYVKYQTYKHGMIIVVETNIRK